MSNVILLIILVLGAFSGARRGLIVQVVHTVGLLVSMVLAMMYYNPLANVLDTVIPYPTNTKAADLNLFNIVKTIQFDKTFYNAIAFVLILFIGWVVTRLLAAMLTQLTKVPVLKQVNALGGGILGFLCHWVGLFFVLSLLSTMPIDTVQKMFTEHSVATFIVKQTPLLSKYVLDAWLVMR